MSIINKEWFKYEKPQDEINVIYIKSCLFVTCIVFTGILMWIHCLLLITIQNSIYPANAFLKGGTNISEVLIFIVPLFSSIAFGMILGNAVLWLFAYTRKKLEQQATNNGQAGFKKSTSSLLKVSIYILIFSLPLEILGIFNYFYVTTDAIFCNKLLSFKESKISWNDISTIEKGCYIDRNILRIKYTVETSTGLKTDIIRNNKKSRETFFRKYNQFEKLIAHQNISYQLITTKAGMKKLESFYPKQYTKIVKIFLEE